MRAWRLMFRRSRSCPATPAAAWPTPARVFTPTQCKPPNSRACSIFTQRSITESMPAARALASASRFFTPICCHRHLALIAIALSAIGPTSSVRRNTSTMSTGSVDVLEARHAAHAENRLVARIDRDHAIALGLHVLRREVARPMPFGRQAHHRDGAGRAEDAAQCADVVAHVRVEGSQSGSITVAAHRHQGCLAGGFETLEPLQRL